MAFELSRSYVAACGLWGMGVLGWRVEGVAGLFGLSNGRRGTAEGKFSPGYLFPPCAVRLHGCVPVRAYMRRRTHAHAHARAKKPSIFSPNLGSCRSPVFGFRKVYKEKEAKRKNINNIYIYLLYIN